MAIGIRLLLLLLLSAFPNHAENLKYATSAKTLQQIGTEIQAADSTTTVVRFSNYASVGKFRLDAPASRIENLVFERDPALESDSAIMVSGDTALFEIKNLKRGTVTLRGLAFHLTSSNAMVLAASELGKANLNLVIDSCIFFGDNIKSPFLSWMGAPGSKVEIKRSYFVFRTGDASTAQINLTATTVLLANNLLNYPGQVFSSIGDQGKFEALSNTIVRTQFRLLSERFEGATYSFVQNLIGHKGIQDAFGGTDLYVLLASYFALPGSGVSYTRLYPGWKGFDHPGSPQKFVLNPTENVVEPVPSKPVDELWNWYTASSDTSVGHQSGKDRRKDKYDIWPGQDSANFRFEMNPGSVYFRPAPFPRQFRDGRLPMIAPGIQPDDLRILASTRGALHFGPFQVDSLTLSMIPGYGRPVLLSGDNGFKFTPQRSAGNYVNPGTVGSVPFPFLNESPNARKFFIAFQGNTPKGSFVVPRFGNTAVSDDTLMYNQVDSSGHTVVKSRRISDSEYPDSLRNLQVDLWVTSSAYVSDSILFGFRDVQLKPWLPQKVHWWNSQGRYLLPTTRIDNGKYLAKIPAVDSFNVYLVEKLNVKRGKTTIFPLRDKGEVRATSASGYQLTIDSTYRPDTLRYGQSPMGYSFSYLGRDPGDSLILNLPGGKDMQAFRVNANSSIDSVPAVDSSGLLTIQVAMADANIRFFSGIRYNVIANQAFVGNLDGVSISGLVSKRSGRIAILKLDQGLLKQGTGAGDILPSDYRVLGGRNIRTSTLELTSGFSAAFKVMTPASDLDVAAYAWNGQGWRFVQVLVPPPDTSGKRDSIIVSVSSLQVGDLAFVVLERLKPAETYVTLDTLVVDRQITVKSSFVNDYHPITSYILIVQKVDRFGEVKTIRRDSFNIGQTGIADLKTESGMFQYGIQYYSATGPYGSPHMKPITTFGWLPDKLAIRKPAKEENWWHLVGFPQGTSFGASFTEENLPSVNVLDTSSVLNLKSVNNKAEWDPIKKDGAMKLVPGDAFLMNSARPHVQKVDPLGSFETAPTKTLSAGVTGGWRFISSPYPMTFHASMVISSVGASKAFLGLKVEPTLVGGKMTRIYSWAIDTVLLAFEGYAYQFQPGETLTFNPWAARRPDLPQAKAGATAGLQALKVSLKSDFGDRTMELRTGELARTIGFLPAPGDGPELRVGGDGGYLWKKVEDLHGIDEAVVIRMPYAQKGGLGLERVGSMASQSDWQARLLNPATGQVFDLTAGNGIAWPAGNSEYRLVAGDGAFVRERVRTFQSGIPSGLSLHQNYPNPFRKTTSIALDWPAMSGVTASAALSRTAWIDVFDSRGRRIQRLDLGIVVTGRQVATLDASNWDPGVYSYRLTVESGGKRVHRQKKMLVLP